MMRNEPKGFSPDQFSTRLKFVLVLIVLMAVGLIARAVELQVLDNGFLEKQGDARVFQGIEFETLQWNQAFLL